MRSIKEIDADIAAARDRRDRLITQASDVWRLENAALLAERRQTKIRERIIALEAALDAPHPNMPMFDRNIKMWVERMNGKTFNSIGREHGITGSRVANVCGRIERMYWRAVAQRCEKNAGDPLFLAEGSCHPLRVQCECKERFSLPQEHPDILNIVRVRLEGNK